MNSQFFCTVSINILARKTLVLEYEYYQEQTGKRPFFFVICLLASSCQESWLWRAWRSVQFSRVGAPQKAGAPSTVEGGAPQRAGDLVLSRTTAFNSAFPPFDLLLRASHANVGINARGLQGIKQQKTPNFNIGPVFKVSEMQKCAIVIVLDLDTLLRRDLSNRKE